VTDSAARVLGVHRQDVDAAGFLSLHGLFTVAEILALPGFCVFVVLARLLNYSLRQLRLDDLKGLLAVEFALLTVAAVLAIAFGPFAEGNGTIALITGMTLVAAMATQNAVHQMHFTKSPPTTALTGTTTRIMIDVADLVMRRGECHADDRDCFGLGDGI
jgi:uncharacterized membrane protein YoaK (UPF0700 family)